MAEPTILAKIKLMVDKSFLTKQLDTIKTGFSPIGETGQAQVPPFIMKSVSAITKPLGAMAVTVGKIFGAITIVAVLLETLKPLISLVEGFIKMVGEFVRPISETITMLFQPLLIMMRPIIQTFRALMLPFRQLASEGLAAANLLIAQGMEQGGETGKTMLGAGMQGVLASASLLFSGFMDIIFAPLKNIQMWGIGDAISNAMDEWQNQALAGVMVVRERADLIRGVWQQLDSLNVTNLRGMFEIIDSSVKEAQHTLGGFNLDNFNEGLLLVQSSTENVKNKFIEFASGMSDTSAAEAFFNSIVDIKDEMPNATANIASFLNVIGMMGEDSKRIAAERALPDFVKGLDEAGKSLRPRAILAFAEGITSLTETGFKGFQSLKIFSESYTRSMETQEERRASILDRLVNDAAKTMGIFGTEYEQGWRKQVSTMSKYWSNSIIPQAYEQGWKKMEQSTNNFVNSLREAGRAIESIGRQAADSARQAADSARQAARRATSNRMW